MFVHSFGINIFPKIGRNFVDLGNHIQLTSLSNISRLKGCSLTTVRIFHSSVSNHRKPIYKTDEAKKLRFFVLTRYIDYLKNYDSGIEKRLTGALQVYRTFMDGVKEFIQDTKDYFMIIRMLYAPGRNFSKLLRREIELYHQMPKDMRKVAPVLIIASVPLGTYIILPLAYILPRHLLCSHFWTLEQKSKFGILDLKDRLSHNRPVFRYLQSQLDFLKPHPLHNLWNEILAKLGSGTQPFVEDILKCKDLFTTEPYHLFYLSRRHVVHLLKMHDMHTGWFRRSRLAEKAFILKEMDKAIMREGGVHNLPIDAMRKSCYIRGLNPTTLQKEEMIQWLTDWIQLSSHIDKDCYSLLLHAPILLGYNKPSNWVLIYKEKS